jgi:hypothetical protein
MKKMMAVLVALIAAISAVASGSLVSDTLESMTPGMEYTSGSYTAANGIVENTFTPQTMTSGLTVNNGNQQIAVSQTAVTSAVGTQTGIDRQELTASASGAVVTVPGLNAANVDPEKDQSKTTMVATLQQDQGTAFSGKLTSALGHGNDANGDGVPDDWYGGADQLTWVVNPAVTGTFSASGSVLGNGITLNTGVSGAQSTVTTKDLTSSPDYQITDSSCAGNGEFWKGYAPNWVGEVPGPLDTTQGAIVDAATGMSSHATLTQTQSSAAGVITTTNKVSGGASLSAEFENAILDDGDNAVALEFDTGSNPFTYWWS